MGVAVPPRSRPPRRRARGPTTRTRTSSAAVQAGAPARRVLPGGASSACSVRDANPTMNHDQLRRRLMRLYHEDTPEQERERKAHEAAFTADKERYAAELTAWEAEVARRYPPQEPAVACGGATDIAALVRAGKAPPNPRSYRRRTRSGTPRARAVRRREPGPEPRRAAQGDAGGVAGGRGGGEGAVRPSRSASRRSTRRTSRCGTRRASAARRRRGRIVARGRAPPPPRTPPPADRQLDRDAAAAWAVAAAASATRRGRAASKRGSYDAAHRRGAWQQDSKDDEDDAANGGIGFRSFSSWQV